MSNPTSTWLRERLHWDAVKEVLGKKTVPIHKHTIWYYMGGMALFLFVVQFITGIMLLFYYKPTADEAFESVQYIMTEVSFGWLIRSVHSWSANILVAVIALHLVSVFFLRAYRKPREVTWISGVFLLYLSLAFGFTGYLLPWNKLAYFATAVGTEMAGSVPFIGEWMLMLLRGGTEITGATLNRFFAIHVWVLPGAFLLFIAVHLYLVQAHGMSEPIGLRSRGTMKFFPQFVMRDIIGWLVALGVLAALAALFPWELGEKADPFAPAPVGIKPEWYFLFTFQTLKLLPAYIGPIAGDTLGALLFGAAAIALFFIPFFDLKADREEKNNLLFRLGIVAIVFIVFMTLWGVLE